MSYYLSPSQRQCSQHSLWRKFDKICITVLILGSDQGKHVNPVMVNMLNSLTEFFVQVDFLCHCFSLCLSFFPPHPVWLISCSSPWQCLRCFFCCNTNYTELEVQNTNMIMILSLSSTENHLTMLINKILTKLQTLLKILSPVVG